MHHHHHQANMDLGQLLAHSRPHTSRSLKISPGFFCLLVCSFALSSVIYYEAFCVYVATIFFLCSCVLSKTGVIFISFAVSVFVSKSVQVYLVLLTYFIAAAVILLPSFALMVNFHYRITKLEGPVYFIILFLHYFRVSVV